MHSENLSVSFNYLLQLVQYYYEPYSVVIPEHVKPSQTGIISKASAFSECGQSVTVDGWGLCIPQLEADQKAAVVGDKIEIFSKGIGYETDGVSITGKVIYYRNPEQAEAHHRRFKENYAAQKQRHRDTFVPDSSWIAKFDIVENKRSDFEKGLQNNSKESYGYGTYAFASQWAAKMEAMKKDGSSIADIAKPACDAVLKESNETLGGLTGAMYGFAVGILANSWRYGEELRTWHNKDIQMGTEGDDANKKGGVLNPAMLGIR